jgi:hypothetical protein
MFGIYARQVLHSWGHAVYDGTPDPFPTPESTTMTATTAPQPAGRIMLRGVRLAFPNLFEPGTVNGEGEPRYSAAFIIPADHPQLKEIEAKMAAVAADKWKDKGPSQLAGLKKQNKVALHDGDEKPNYDGFPGNFFISASAKVDSRPTVLNTDKTPLTERDGRIYAGCWVNASLDFWAQDNGYGKRINAQLRGVQFLRDGDAFSAGRPADSDEFEAVTEGADADDLA